MGKGTDRFAQSILRPSSHQAADNIAEDEEP